MAQALEKENPMAEALEGSVVDNHMAQVPEWRHAGEFLVRHIPVQGDGRARIEEAVHSVEGSAERCTFTDTETGVMIYLGDAAGEGIAEQDFQTAQRIDSALA
jgi:hypothetical protein